MSTQVIPVRELNQHTSAVLKRVRSGEELLVSVSGKVVARLTPISEDEAALRELAARGDVILATHASAVPPAPGDRGPFPRLHRRRTRSCAKRAAGDLPRYLRRREARAATRKESQALFDWLDLHEGESLISSVLLEVELERALRRVEPAALERIPRILSAISRVELNGTIRATAGAYQDPLLRSLDAIHLATAQTVAESTGTAIERLRHLRQAADRRRPRRGDPRRTPGARY
jgi:prevent-host-death family protein